MFLFTSVDQLAKACTFDCHNALCNFRQQKRVLVVSSHLVVSQSVEKVQSTDRRVNWKEHRSSWQKQQAEAAVEWSLHPSPVATAPKRASFSLLDSLYVDLFAGSVPQREILKCLCAKLNISFLLGNLIFQRRGNNIFLRELPAKHFPQEETSFGAFSPPLSA